MLECMRTRTTAAVAATVMLGAGAATVAAGRYACAVALRGAGRAEEAGFPGGTPLTVHEVDDHRVVLTRTLETLSPGIHGITGPTGHAVTGPVLDTLGPADTVIRRLERPSRGPLSPGDPVRLTPRVYSGDPGSALGLAYQDVGVPGELGTLPAWFVPGPRDTWVIVLHGLGATRENTLNVLSFLHGQHFPVLIPAYRGDPGAPGPRDGLSRLGETEWHDADAALRYALRQGARRVIFYGFSVGATMALRAATGSAVRDQIGALILDSPVLDPPTTLRALAAQRRVPRLLWPLVVRAAPPGVGLDGSPAPSLRERPGGLRDLPLPVLLLHGPGDNVAPWSASRALAARYPDTISTHTIHHAQHAALWNAAPQAYQEALRRFLTPLM